ncbi:MAG: hypothetical protein QNK23_14410 [Crocinitomicaceae bacterium]|nr:hypothetical protein [Crocinitomicaceae bacterium]
MARIIDGKFIPTDIISKALIGTDTNGKVKELMLIDRVDEFDPSGSISSHIRIILNNLTEGVRDTFYFSENEDMKLTGAFIQTTEANQKLMDKEMMLIQDRTNLNNFIVEMARQYYVADLGYEEVRIM